MIEVRLAGLETVAAPAIVWPVTAEWTAVTPAMRSVETAVGDAVLSQCREMGELPVGTAIVTGPGDLPAELLIHVVVRSRTEPVTAGGIGKGLRNALRRADEWGVDALAIPPLGLGAGSLDAEAAADVMVPILKEWFLNDPRPRRVVVVVTSEYEREVFETATGSDGVRNRGAIGLPLLDP